MSQTARAYSYEEFLKENDPNLFVHVICGSDLVPQRYVFLLFGNDEPSTDDQKLLTNHWIEERMYYGNSRPFLAIWEHRPFKNLEKQKTLTWRQAYEWAKHRCWERESEIARLRREIAQLRSQRLEQGI